MANLRGQIVPLVSALICVALQIVVAPMISLFSVVPNFIVAFVLVLSIVRKPDSTYVYAFVLGLVSDLLGSGPVGLTSLLLLLASFALSRAFEVMDKTTFAMPVIASAVVIVLFLAVYVIVLLITGYTASFFELLIQRIIPEAVYDTLIVAILYFVSTKFNITEESSDAWSVPETRRYR